MKLVPFAAALAAIAIVQPATASDPQAAAQENNNSKADKASDRKICRSVERVGSNIRDRICLTREKWREVDEYLRTGE